MLVRGIRIGSEEVDVTRPGGGLKIASSGQLSPPFDLVTHKFEMTYTSDWQPQLLAIEALLGGQPLTLRTTFGLTTATSEMVQGTKRGSVTHDVSPRAAVLPRNFFGAYEVLAARLGSIAPGGRVPVYVAPDGEVSATLERVSDRRVSGPHGTTALKEYDLTFSQPRATTLQLWVDERGRLARLVVPSASLMVIRDDLSSVMVREEKVRHPGDEDVFIPASGFNLAATITVPATAAGERKPVVIFVGRPGRQDRDEVLYGMPLFGALAGALADAGYLAVRFDKRGVGQSGGRPEHATLTEYAEDVIAIVNWARRRRDVDGDRIAVVGHGEGGAVAMLAAARQGRIKALALIAAPGATGREVTLGQQERALAAGNAADADVQAKIAMQRQIMDAAVSGDGWDAIPPDIRRQTDTPWYRSWLTFDPAQTIRRTDAPILILHGGLDTEMPLAYADRLEALSAARRKNRPELTTKVVLDGVNHLLIDAKTGSVEEYETLEKTLSPAAVKTLTDWLARVLPAER